MWSSNRGRGEAILTIISTALFLKTQNFSVFSKERVRCWLRMRKEFTIQYRSSIFKLPSQQENQGPFKKYIFKIRSSCKEKLTTILPLQLSESAITLDPTLISKSFRSIKNILLLTRETFQTSMGTSGWTISGEKVRASSSYLWRIMSTHPSSPILLIVLSRSTRYLPRKKSFGKTKEDGNPNKCIFWTTFS